MYSTESSNDSIYSLNSECIFCFGDTAQLFYFSFPIKDIKDIKDLDKSENENQKNKITRGNGFCLTLLRNIISEEFSRTTSFQSLKI